MPQGDIATSLGLPLEQQPKGAEFLEKYQAKFGKAPEAYDSYAYDAANTIIAAVLKAGADRAAVADAIRAGSIDGVTGTVPSTRTATTSSRSSRQYKVENGEWVQIKQ